MTTANGGPLYWTPSWITHSFNDTNCPDALVSGQTDQQCALYKLQLFGGNVLTPPAPYASNLYSFADTVVPLSAGTWCEDVEKGFAVTNVSPRYNDINFQMPLYADVTWYWQVTSGNLNANHTIPAGTAANSPNHTYQQDVGSYFRGPPYYIYPSTPYTVTFYAGGYPSP